MSSAERPRADEVDPRRRPKGEGPSGPESIPLSPPVGSSRVPRILSGRRPSSGFSVLRGMTPER